ncbi:DNA repair protein RecO [Candidatus Saccharibacteria bacterium]|nr:DNA repair protein RecO [Candidatus Saccharibacteria bacterium]
MKNTVRSSAFVLRRTNFGEADRVLDLLTPQGRVSVMARGVRKEKSKLAGGIELFAICDVVVANGKGSLGLLVSARLVKFYRHILDDYDRMQFAYEVLAQVANVSSHLDEAAWYDIVDEVLSALDDVTVSLFLVQTWFYVRIAALLGDELNVMRDVNGSKLQSGETYRYDGVEKGFVKDSKGNIADAHIKILRLVSIKTLHVVAQVGGVADYLAECVLIARHHASLRQIVK